MSGLKGILKNNVITNQDRYYDIHEKVGKVISINEDKETCNIIYINRDHINTILKDVPVKVNESLKNWFPKVDEYVGLKEYDQKIYVEKSISKSALEDSSTPSDKYSFSYDNDGGFVTP